LCLTHGVERHGREVWLLVGICLVSSAIGLHGLHGIVVLFFFGSGSGSTAAGTCLPGTNAAHRERDPGALEDIAYGAKGSACGRLDGPLVGGRQVDGHENSTWIRELLRNLGIEVVDRALP
jgi:hypothetical protein